jgi:diguanylate cyclase (GGDEF)-like protein/PAS domain S-box-containing protein
VVTESTVVGRRHRAPPRRSRSPLGWAWPLVAMALTAVPYTRVSTDSVWSPVLSDGVMVVCSAAIWWAGLSQRRNRAVWYLASASILAYACGDLGWYGVIWVTGTEPMYASIADVFYLAYYPLMAAALLVLYRRRRTGAADWATALDGLIITTGLALVIGMILVLPAMASAAGSPSGQAVALAYPLGDIVLLGVAVRLAVSAGRRPVSYYLLAGGILAMLAGDLTYSYQLIAGTYVGGGWLDLSWMLAQAMVASAALHPSVADLARPVGADRTAGSTRGRLLGLTVAALVGPVAAAVAPDLKSCRLALVATGVMFVLILVRLEVVTGTLRRAEARFRSLVTNAADGIVVLDRQGVVGYASPPTASLLHPLADGRFGADVHPDDQLIVDAAMDRVRDQPPGGTVAFTARVRHRDGDWRFVEAVASNQLNDPAVDGVVVNLRDVTDRAGLEAQLRDQALHDPVTGLANRSLFLDRAGQALARLDRGRGTVAVLAVDLDDFGAVDDELGHRLGDEVLAAIGERLTGCVQPCDTVARLGGDEFAVLLTEVVNERQVTAVADRILDVIRYPLSVRENTARVTASIGIALGAPGLPAGTLLRNATVAMHAAGQGGRSRLSVFDPALAAAGFPPLRLVADA